LLLGPKLIDRWTLWQPSIDALGPDVYPLFADLVSRMQQRIDGQTGRAASSRK
jgi:hypothetical protein